MNNKRMIVLLVISILIVIACTVGITYAYLSVSNVQSDPNTIETSCYDIAFEDSNRIEITSYPMSSIKALKQTPYSFKITNICQTNTNYQIILNIVDNTSEEILPYINYSLDGITVNKLSSLTPIALPIGAVSENISYSYLINTGSLTGINSENNYKLHMWIDESAGNDIMGSIFEAEVMVYNVATQ